MSWVTSDSSSSVGGDMVVDALSNATLITSSESHGCSTQGGTASSSSSTVSPNPSNASAMQV